MFTKLLTPLVPCCVRALKGCGHSSVPAGHIWGCNREERADFADVSQSYAENKQNVLKNHLRSAL